MSKDNAMERAFRMRANDLWTMMRDLRALQNRIQLLAEELTRPDEYTGATAARSIRRIEDELERLAHVAELVKEEIDKIEDDEAKRRKEMR